jgi:hypothetical protein
MENQSSFTAVRENAPPAMHAHLLLYQKKLIMSFHFSIASHEVVLGWFWADELKINYPKFY